MSRELLPATYPTKEEAELRAKAFTHRTIIQSETKVVGPHKETGRYQISIRRRPDREGAELL